jgi:tripartite-type tricarboxylate transporter receptor subunit TctC
MKKLARRRFLRVAAGAAALPVVSRIAWAQAYPTRPVRLLVGFAAGGTADIIARFMAQWLSMRLDQQFIVENRAGAASNIAVEALVRASPDGYTLLVGSGSIAINAALYNKLNFNIIRDTVPIAGIARVPNVMAIHPSIPARTVPEFIAHAKSNPGKINHASAGVGTPGHLAGELFKAMTGIQFIHVPYRGNAPALADLLAGQVQVGFDGMPSSIEYIKAGKLYALAVTTATRSEAEPGIPTVSEFVPGYETSTFYGVIAPKNTPADIVDTLNRAINAALVDPAMRTRLTGLGGMMLPGSPGDFGRLIADETEKWGKVIQTANIKPE